MASNVACVRLDVAVDFRVAIFVVSHSSCLSSFLGLAARSFFTFSLHSGCALGFCFETVRDGSVVFDEANDEAGWISDRIRVLADSWIVLLSVFQLRDEVLLLAGLQVRKKFMSFLFVDAAPGEFGNEHGIEMLVARESL